MPKTPTIAVFVRGGLVQDVCADMPCRVIVLDFDTGGISADDDRAVKHTHPDGTGEYAELADYDFGQTPPARDELPHVLCAIATAADAEHGSDEPTEITNRA